MVPSSRGIACQPRAWDSSPVREGAISRSVDELSRTLASGRTAAISCEPTAEGILSAVGIGYLAHADPEAIRVVRGDTCQPMLGEEVVEAPPTAADETVALARRVLRGFEAHISEGCPRSRGGKCPVRCSGSCVRRVLYASGSSAQDAPEVIHRYLRLAFAQGGRARTCMQDPRVSALSGLALSVSNECEKTRQFVRFNRQPDGSFAATFSPRDDTIPLTSGYFADRLREDRFFILDPTHLVAAFHLPGRRRCRGTKTGTPG